MSLQARIDARLDRVRLGNFGDHKALGEGLFELRIHGGSGYRIYFATDREAIVLLLCGGGKNTQKRDIAKAKRYWRDYLESSS